MDLKVFWTDTARYQLEDIFNFYKTKASLKTAKEIVTRIVEKTLVLGKNPNLGQKEEFLASRRND